MTKEDIIRQLKAIAEDCQRMTSGNVSHLAPQIRGQILIVADSLEHQPKKKRVMLDTSIVPTLYIEVIDRWLSYKKEKNQSYTQTGFNACVKKLIQLSSGDVQLAEQIVYQSMANNYAGLFPLKNERYNNINQGATNVFIAAQKILQED